MAFINTNDPNQQNQQQTGQTQSQPVNGVQTSAGSGGQAPTVSGSGGADVGSPGGAASGAGGQGSFTNIQAYLNANQGNTGSAQNLSNQAGQQFSKEQNQMQDQSNQALQAGQDSANKSNISNDQANQLIQNAGNAYSYSGPQSDAYNGYVSQVQGALTGPYGGPTQFNYSLGNDTQNFGNALQDDRGFQSLMTNLDSQRAGTPLTSGEATLQNQFNVNNPALAQARQNLIGQYSGLQNQANQLNQNTSQALQNDQSQFAQNQTNLQNYLNNQANNFNSQIGTDEQNARASYQNALQTGLSGQTTGYGAGDAIDTSESHTWPQPWMAAPNATWQDLQNESDLASGKNPLGNQQAPLWTTGQTYGGLLTGVGPNASSAYGNAAQKQFQQNMQALQNFYNTQEQQYAGTDQAQRNQWNAIQDFLNSAAPRQQQYFDVGAPASKLPTMIAGR